MTLDMTTLPLPVLFYSTAGILATLLVLVIHLELRVHRLLAGKNCKSLEDSILHIKNGLVEQEKFQKEMEKYLTVVEKRISRTVRGVETIRFNAFKGIGSGGNMSFATAYVTEKGDGVVISTLNARDRMGIFAKPLKAFKSEFELSPEEAEAVEKAKKSLAL